MTSKSEIRQFKISTSMIFHTIESQAGSIEKAILECLMNAVDAGATSVSVDITETGYVISDNGRGFQTKDEILACFEVFGFDHKTEEEISKGRTFGTFGIGRAQLWAFSSNRWLTNEFSLDVDIKRKGLDYTLTDEASSFDGCKIVGDFYKPQSLSDLQDIQRSLIHLALYLPIHFTLNDKVVSKKLEDQKWTHNTDQAFIKLNDNGMLEVYNLGVFVCAFPNYLFGKGGLVVSKVQLSLNTARNDILKSKCNVWKNIHKYLKKTATDDNLKRVSLDDNSRKNLLRQWSDREINYDQLKGKRLLPDITGRYQTLSSLSKFNFKFTIAPDNFSQVGETIHSNQICFVFSNSVLDLFDIDDRTELAKKLTALYSSCGLLNLREQKIESLDFDVLSEEHKSSYSTIPKDKYTNKQEQFMSLAQTINKQIPSLLNSFLRNTIDQKIGERTLLLGQSNNANAWTDSVSYIGLSDQFIKCIDEGQRGIQKVIYILIHEYLHNESSLGDHAHSEEFYENFHNIILEKYTAINTILLDAKPRYIKLLTKNNLSFPREYLRDSRREIEQGAMTG